MFITTSIIFIIFALITNISLELSIYISSIGLIIISILTIFSTYVVILINSINKPIEDSINKGFYNAAKKKLEEMPNMKVIGITGSYGKTSTKYILSTILEQKYNVLMTPESFNTTLGVVRTINENLNSMHQIFVCEMGAKNIGDIKEICDLVHPEYGILTAIGPQHLETFKSLENVRKTKMELVEAVTNKAFVNYEDENIIETKIEKDNIKYGISQNCDTYAYDIKITEEGSIFNVHTKDGEITNIKTKLLGEHNIQNILGCIAIAVHLGLTNEQIANGIAKIKPIEHRLQILPNKNGITVIDDAFNSNPVGSKMALDVLKSFEGRKIIITPGMVELRKR